MKPNIREPRDPDEVCIISEGTRREHREPLYREAGDVEESVIHPEFLRCSLEDAVYYLSAFLWVSVEPVDFVEALLRDFTQHVGLHLFFV